MEANLVKARNAGTGPLAGATAASEYMMDQVPVAPISDRGRPTRAACPRCDYVVCRCNREAQKPREAQVDYSKLTEPKVVRVAPAKVVGKPRLVGADSAPTLDIPEPAPPQTLAATPPVIPTPAPHQATESEVIPDDQVPPRRGFAVLMYAAIEADLTALPVGKTLCWLKAPEKRKAFMALKRIRERHNMRYDAWFHGGKCYIKKVGPRP